MIDFEKYIAMPVDKAKKSLEENGYNVQIKDFSKPKTSSGEMLVVKVSCFENNNILLWIADFKIDI